MTLETKIDNEKKLKILIVEDNEKHMADAKALFSYIEYGNRTEFDFATNYTDALNLLNNNQYEGIISDAFMPDDANDNINHKIRKKLEFEIKTDSNGNDTQKEFYDYQKEIMRKWIDGEKLAPLGALLTLKAKKSNIYSIICSDRNHHNEELELIYDSKFYNFMFTEANVDPISTTNQTNKKWLDSYVKILKNYLNLDLRTSEKLENINKMVPKNIEEFEYIKKELPNLRNIYLFNEQYQEFKSKIKPYAPTDKILEKITSTEHYFLMKTAESIFSKVYEDSEVPYSRNKFCNLCSCANNLNDIHKIMLSQK